MLPPTLPWHTLDRARTTDGAELTLSCRDTQFAIRVDGQELMSSDSHGSEEKLAVHGCAGLGAVSGVRVLIGGLGMGFTARAALEELALDAQVDVVELVSAVVRWNREVIGHLAGAPLLDPRVRVIEGDVTDSIESARDHYDVILLDVDNGPYALTSSVNRRIYTPAGLAIARRALRPDGVLALWSSFESSRFTARLRSAGFDVVVKRVRARSREDQRHVLWLARAPETSHPSC